MAGRKVTTPERATRPSAPNFNTSAIVASLKSQGETSSSMLAKAESLRGLRTPSRLKRPFGNDGQLLDMGEVVCPLCKQSQPSLIKALREAEDALQARGIAPYSGYPTVLTTEPSRWTETEKLIKKWEHQVALLETPHFKHVIQDATKEALTRKD